MIHLPVPVIVVGLAGTAATIRILRSQLLDEFNKQYVTTARSKGLGEWRLILKYPFRVAMNPIVSTISTLLPSIVSGSTIVAIVLGLPTIGPLLLRAIVAQDTYVAAILPDALGHDDGRRRVPVRHAFDVARPAPAHGARRMSATVAIAHAKDGAEDSFATHAGLVALPPPQGRAIQPLVLAALYVIVLFAEFFAPYDPFGRTPTALLSPPTAVHFFGDDWTPAAPICLRSQVGTRSADLSAPLCRGSQRPLSGPVSSCAASPIVSFGLFETDLHLFGVDEARRRLPCAAPTALGAIF